MTIEMLHLHHFGEGHTTVLARSEIMGVECSVHDKVRNMFDVLVNLPPPASQEDQKTTDELLWGMTFFQQASCCPLCVCVCVFWYEVKEHGYEFFVSLGNHFH